MPYLVQTGSPAPWFQATNDALDTMINVAGQDRARRLQEDAQIRGEGRADTRQQAGETRQNQEWGRRQGVLQGQQVAQENRQNTRQDVLRREGYGREAAGGGAMLRIAQAAGLVPPETGNDLGALQAQNEQAGPNQGAVPIPHILQALAGEHLRRQAEARQAQEAQSIVGAAAGSGTIPAFMPGDGSAGPAPLPRFQTPQAAQGWINDVQQTERTRAIDETNRMKAGETASAAERRQAEIERHNREMEKIGKDSSFNRGGERDRHTMLSSLAKTAESLQGGDWYKAADGWLNRHFGTDWQKSPEAQKAGVVDAQGNPNMKAIGDIVDAQIKGYMNQGPPAAPKPNTTATPMSKPNGPADFDPEMDAIIDMMMRQMPK